MLEQVPAPTIPKLNNIFSLKVDISENSEVEISSENSEFDLLGNTYFSLDELATVLKN